MENKTDQGIIFNIQRFSIHDGPGIRTLVFTKGCPLRCRWCSNPEGLSSIITVLSRPGLCIGCGACLGTCKHQAIIIDPKQGFSIDRNKCVNCLACAKVCPSNSKSISGEVKTVDEIVAIVEKDKPFYKHSEGGITVGGGEMLHQPAFTFELLKKCRELHLNTAVETSGHGDFDWLCKIASQCDTIHFDIKAYDPSLHKQLTGVSNIHILDNLKKLSTWIRSQKEPRPELILRLPLIEGYNTNPEEIRQIADFIATKLDYYTLTEVLLFHNFGSKRYEEMGLTYELANRINAKIEDLQEQVQILKDANLRLKVPKW